MNLSNRIRVLADLKSFIENNLMNNTAFLSQVQAQNKWFIPQFTKMRLQHICHSFLLKRNLCRFSKEHNMDVLPELYDKQIGILASGNIPLVCFHDILCSYLSGLSINIKASSRDFILIKTVCDFISQQTSKFSQQKILLTERLKKNYNAYLLTGNSKSTTIFKEYLSGNNVLIRGDKTSVCRIFGNENEQELMDIADGIVEYFGMGCKSITHIVCPKGYTFDALFTFISNKYNGILKKHTAYMNNFEYQLSAMIISRREYFSNGVVTFLKDNNLKKGLSVVTFSHNEENINLSHNDAVQNIYSKEKKNVHNIQTPNINFFSDNKNTIHFLKLQIKKNIN